MAEYKTMKIPEPVWRKLKILAAEKGLSLIKLLDELAEGENENENENG